MKTKSTNCKSFFFRTAMTLLVVLTGFAQGARATDFITDVMLIGGTEDEVNNLKTTYQDQGWAVIDNDLNAGCGSSSDYIYLLYKTADADNTDNLTFITDFYISDARGSNPDEEVSFNGRTYHLVPYKGGEHFKTVMGNLNSNCGSASDDIHLYYTYEFTSGNNAVSEITFDNSKDGAVGKNGDTSSGYDLNAGCGSESKYIYLHIDNSKRASWWTISKTDDGCLITGYEGEKDKVSAITIPNTIEDKKVTGIGDYAFRNYSGLTSISIPNSVMSIGNWAFFSCPSLASATIPNSVTSIGNGAFQNCPSLTSIIIPNSVTSIQYHTFYYCPSLTSITIPNSVTSIKVSAFQYCSSLTSITIPNSVTSIELGAFWNCSSLTSFSVDEGNPNYDSRNNCNAIIETSSNTLIAGCKNTVIPNSVTSIGMGAFIGCSSLTSITIPNNVTSIGDHAFHDCSDLTSVTINNSKVKIGTGAFNDVSAVFDFPDDFEYGGYNSLDELISETGVKSFQLADKTSVTISDAGVATFYSFRGLDLSEVEGLKAYIAKEYDKTTQRVTMQEVKEVPAYTGLLLVGAAGTYELPYKASDDIAAVDAGLLAGTIEAITIPSTENDMTNFVLYATTDTKPSFRPLTNGFNLKANRAYLQLPTADLPEASASSNVSIEFVEATGIEEISNLKPQILPSISWYTLDGRRLNSKPTQKGMYIVNGQKVVIK